MKKPYSILILVSLVLLLIQCGGVKKLTPEEYNKLSPQEKITYLEKYTSQNPSDIDAKKELYKDYLALDMPDKAIKVMQSIIETDSDQPDVQFEYGEMMMRRGETMIAYQAFRDALNAPGGTKYASRISNYLGGKYSIQQVTSSKADEAFPVFSPDGSKIYYQTNENGNWDIAERDLVSGETKLVLHTSADEELPFISPDGKEMVYTSNADDRRPIDNKFKVREIYIMDFGTGYTKNLTESIADDWLPRYSHNGQFIVFVSERSDLRSVPYTEKQSDVYKMESDGDFHLRLTNDDSNDGGGCFSVDDSKIFFHSNRNGTYDIFVMKADGTLPMTVLGTPESNEVNPFVSPDSIHFVFFSDQGGSYDIYQAKVDGSDLERLTFNPAQNTNPAYSPDGTLVAYHSNQNGNYDIFIVNLKSTSEPTSRELVNRLDNLLR
jgi:Tol biopolymer transport system component